MRSRQERSFHIFYQLCAGADSRMEGKPWSQAHHRLNLQFCFEVYFTFQSVLIRPKKINKKEREKKTAGRNRHPTVSK